VSPLDHVVRLGRLLDSLDVPWALGGSLASSFVGEPRSTVDIDVAVALEVGDVDELVAAVQAEYYVSAEMAHDAVLHHQSGVTIDLFSLSDDPLDARQLARRQLARALNATG
jgi:hypothetical protein